MDRGVISLAIVGCGGMGHRHLYGLAELQAAGLNQFQLVAACDPVVENAESLATTAEEHLKYRPRVVSSLETLAWLNVEAIDITTDPRHHHTLAIEALKRGWHVMVEKPMGLTVKACRLMSEAASKSTAVLSVAENYRRDPMNRLAKALIEAGVIGEPRVFQQFSFSGANRMMITPWRHQKDRSGLLLDVGAHYTDMMEYLIGPVQSAYAQTRLHEAVRKNPAPDTRTFARSGVTPFYQKWQVNFPREFECTAEDAAYAVLTFENGAVAHFAEDHAGHGRAQSQRAIYGSTGSLELPSDRTGKAITLTDDTGLSISDETLLKFVPDFSLDEATARIFGGERMTGYNFESFAIVDRKIIAIEYAEFAQSILKRLSPEVGPEEGMRAVAVCYAMLESGKCGKPVAVRDVLAGQASAYQREIDLAIGISAP